VLIYSIAAAYNGHVEAHQHAREALARGATQEVSRGQRVPWPVFIFTIQEACKSAVHSLTTLGECTGRRADSMGYAT
jgi:hypothetical protein